MSDIAMLYHGNSEELHPAHRGFAESIDADVLSISNTSPHSIKSFYQELNQAYSIGEYDIVIAEGSRPLYAGLVHKTIYNSQLVYLCADHRLYDLWNSSIEVDSTYDLVKHLLGNHGKPFVRTVAQRGIDGIIAVSDFVEEYLRPIVEDRVPIRIAHPYIQSPLYEQLGQIEPDVSRKVALTVGRSTRYKGVDMLVEAWPSVREQHHDAELHVVGKNHPESFENRSGVTVHGFVEDITDVYATTSLYVQPSRVDPFPVTVLEALRTGLPAVVTESTGSRSEIEKLDERLIAPATPDGLSEAISFYFEMSNEERESIANTAEEQGKKFSSTEKKSEFQKEFEKLAHEMGVFQL